MKYFIVFSALIALAVVLTGTPILPEEQGVFLREDFIDISRWKPQHFPKIEAHSIYTIEKSGQESYLKAVSHASASGLVYNGSFNVYQYHRIRWRWKVENIYVKGDARSKSGDDYPCRIYIVFEYDPGKAGFWDKVKYNTARVIYGQYPPHSSLNYIWANREYAEEILTSPYTERSKMIPLEEGGEHINRWRIEEVDVLEDYRRAFGEPPPGKASLAIMSDSDNTGESATSFIDFIEVYK